MTSNGEGLRQLTTSPQEEWAPDVISSDVVIFLRQEEDSIFRVQLNINTEVETIIPHPVDCPLDDKNTLHSPDFQAFAYPCNGEIYLQIPFNKPPINITQNLPGTSNYPSWSPDGSYILFTNNGGGSNDIYQYSVKEETIVQLTDDEFNNERGSFSADNTQLLYSSNKLGESGQDLILQERSTKNERFIKVKQGMELIGRWGSGDQYIYFGSNGDGNWEIYRYALKTQKIQRLTNSAEFDGDPRIITLEN